MKKHARAIHRPGRRKAEAVMSPEEFKAVRDALRMSPLQLALEMGITERHIRNLEAGTSPVNRALANNLSAVKTKHARPSSVHA